MFFRLSLTVVIWMHETWHSKTLKICIHADLPWFSINIEFVIVFFVITSKGHIFTVDIHTSVPWFIQKISFFICFKTYQNDEVRPLYLVAFIISPRCAVFPTEAKYLGKNKTECGLFQNVIKQQSESRIINGEALDEKYPWMVQVYYKRKGWAGSAPKWKHSVCRGSLITDKAVLTSGHRVSSLYDPATATEKWPSTCKLNWIFEACLN